MMAVTLSSMRLLALVFSGLALAYVGPCNAHVINQKRVVATPGQTAPDDTDLNRSGSSQEPLEKRLNDTNGLIRPPGGVDPGLSIPLFLAPVLWRDAVETDCLFVLAAVTSYMSRG